MKLTKLLNEIIFFIELTKLK